MSFASAQLADTPDVRYGLGDTVGSSTLADDSGNGATGTVLSTLTGGAPSTVTLGQTGLVGSVDTAIRLGGVGTGQGGFRTPAVGSSAAWYVEFVVKPVGGSWYVSVLAKDGTTPVVEASFGTGRGDLGHGSTVEYYESTGLPLGASVDFDTSHQLHVVMGVDSSGVSHVYIDGVEVDTHDYSAFTLRISTANPTVEVSGTGCWVDEFAHYDTDTSLADFQAHLAQIPVLFTAPTMPLSRWTATSSIDVPPYFVGDLTLPGWASVSDIVVPRVESVTRATSGLDFDGGARVVLNPPVVAPPAGVVLAEARVVARAIDEAPSLTATAVARTADTPEAINRVLVNSRDMTYAGGAYVQVDNIKLIDPLLYGSAQVTFPGINPQFVDYDLVERYAHARVKIQRVLDGVVVATDYKGFVSRIDTSGTQLVLQLGGEAAGRLSGLYVPPPVYRRKQDVEHILCDTLRDARVRAHEHDGTSGLGIIRRGGTDGLSIFNETLAVWAGATDSPITFTPNADGAYRKLVKDTDTIHATAYIDSSLVSQELSIDFAEVPMARRVFARGFTAAGELVANIKTPGMTQGEIPDFPNGDNSPLELGDTDADTDTGAGVTAVQEQLAIHNFYDVEDGNPGTYTNEVASAVEGFQEFAGLNVTGEVGRNTWEAMWNVVSIGYSLDDAREYPTAQDVRMVKWFRAANGSKIAANPDYDPHLPPNDVFIDVGGPFGKGQVNRFARLALAPEAGVWQGQLTFRSGLIAGEHNPGDPLSSADVLDRRDLRPNMNVWLPYFNSTGLLVTVTGVDHNPDESQALVSTHPATTMETWAAIERRREGKSNPGRAWSGHVRESQVRRDTGPTWDTSSGLLANKVALETGWNEVKIPAGQAGIVQRIKMQLEDAAEFAVIITQKPVSVEGLNSRIDPMAAPTGRPWFEREGIVNWLNKRGLLDAWGTPGQPCGYDPSRKTGDDGTATAEPVTGLFVEYASMTYETGTEPVLYTYVWVGSSNALKPGRVLRNQRTTDF